MINIWYLTPGKDLQAASHSSFQEIIRNRTGYIGDKGILSVKENYGKILAIEKLPKSKQNCYCDTISLVYGLTLQTVFMKIWGWAIQLPLMQFLLQLWYTVIIKITCPHSSACTSKISYGPCVYTQIIHLQRTILIHCYGWKVLHSPPNITCSFISGINRFHWPWLNNLNQFIHVYTKQTYSIILCKYSQLPDHCIFTYLFTNLDNSSMYCSTAGCSSARGLYIYIPLGELINCLKGEKEKKIKKRIEIWEWLRRTLSE